MLMIVFIVGLTACDSTENFNEPRKETRTMIIGGVPAHDRDYQIDDNANILVKQK